MEQKYLIFRYYVRDDRQEVIKTNLTLLEALDHCKDPETMFDYAMSQEAAERTEKHGPWWDCWTTENQYYSSMHDPGEPL